MPLLDARSDRQLIAAHRAGERRAFDELVRRYGDRLWSVALRVVQEALIAAYTRVESYRGESEVSTWLHRIVVNKCIDRIRHDRSRATRRRHVLLPTPRDPADQATTRLAVVDALTHLPVEQRLAVVLVDVEGYPVAEAARILECPPGTVKSRCARGRLRLAALLGHLREDA